MADEKLVRLHNLRALLKTRRIEDRERARYLKGHLGSGASYWSGLLAGDRSFGEKVARRIEEGLNLLPRGILDAPDNEWTPAQPSLEGVSVRTVAQEMIQSEPED